MTKGEILEFIRTKALEMSYEDFFTAMTDLYLTEKYKSLVESA